MRSHVLEWEFHGIPMNSNEVQVSDSRASPRSTGRWSLGWQERFRASCNEAPSYTQQPSAAIDQPPQSRWRSGVEVTCCRRMPSWNATFNKEALRRASWSRPNDKLDTSIRIQQDMESVVWSCWTGKDEAIIDRSIRSNMHRVKGSSAHWRSLAPGDHCSGYHLRPSLLILMKRKQRQGFYTQIGRCCCKSMQKQKHRT